MSDNPSGEDLFTLGLGVDDQVTGVIDKLTEEIHRLETAVLGAADKLGNDSFISFTQKIDDISNSIRQGDDTIASYQNQVTKLSTGYNDLDAELKKIIADYEQLNKLQTEAQTSSAYNRGEFINEAAAGYGVKGGMVGPEEPGLDEGSTKAPSLYAIARAGRGLGQLAGNSQAGQSVASVLYITQAAEQMRDLNAALEASGGLVPPLTEGLVSLGVPMAGLVSLVLPIAAGIGAIVAVTAAYNAEIKASEEALAQAIVAYHEYLNVIAEGTTKDLASKRNLAQESATAADTEVNTWKQKMAEGAIDAFKQGGAAGVVLFQNTQGYKDMAKSLDDAEKAANKFHGEVDGLTNALNDPKVKANDAAEAALAEADKRSEAAKQLAADDKLSTEAIKANVTALKDDIATRAANNLNLMNARDVAEKAGAGAEKITALTDAINANKDAIEVDQERVNHLNDVSMKLAETRESEAAAAKLQTEITKEHVSFLEQENKLRQAGTPDQFASARLGIVDKRLGAQSELDTLNAQASPWTPDQVQRAKELTALVTEYNAQLKALDDNIKPVVDARDAIVQMEAAAEDFNKKQKTLADQLQQQGDGARAKELLAEQQYTLGSLQDVHERNRIKADEDEKGVQLAQATADRIADIGNKLALQQAQLALDFDRQQADDITKYEDQKGKLIRDAQSTQREDEVAHQSRLREIRDADKSDERRALLDRNFLKLAEDRLSQAKQIDNENTAYAEREAKLQRHLNDQEVELAISLANEQKQQRVAYIRKFEDMQNAAQQEILQLQVNEERKRLELQESERRQLQDLTTNETYKIQLLQQGLQNELTLYGQQEQAKRTIAQQNFDALMAYYQAQLAQAFASNPSAVGGNTVIGGGGGTSYMYADGGNFNADQSFIMSEEAPENLMFGGKGYNVNGAAMVYPLQSGSVTQASSGQRVFAPVINLNGTTSEPITPEMIQNIVYDVWEDVEDG